MSDIFETPDVIINPYRFATVGGGGTGLTSGLVHWWDLDETSGSSSDSEGSLTLVVENATGLTYDTDAPDSGNARDFGGQANLHATSGADVFYGTATDLTIAFWFRKDSGAGQDYLFSVKDTDLGNHNRFRSNGSEEIDIEIEGTTIITSSAHSFDTWYSLIYVSDNGTGSELFLNGTSAGTSATDWYFPTTSDEIVLPGTQTGGAPLEGNIVSMGVWNRKFDSGDVADFHNSGTNLRYADL